MSVTVRPYVEGDLPRVLELAPRLTEGVAPWRDPDAVLASVRAWVRDSVGRAGTSEAEVYVAELADEKGVAVCGFVSVTTKQHFSGQTDAYIGELVVAETAERSGVGTALVDAASRWAAARGLTTLTLETGAANAPARAFYERLGFEEEDVKLTRPS